MSKGSMAASVTVTAMIQKERQEAIKRVQQEMAEGSVTGSDGVPEGGAVPESSIKEEEAIRALFHRGLSADLILKWPTPLAELLEFSCAGDMKVRVCSSERTALQSVRMC